MRIAWGVLCLLCAVGVLFGAWWHIWTTIISYVMYSSANDECERDTDH
ncbi:MAG: hypothetical protein WCS17_01730 [Prevotella sp.]